MNNKNKILIGVALAVLALIAVALLFKPWKAPADDETLRVGLLIALTGYAGEFGQGQMNAAKLLESDFPSVRFFIEDNQSDVSSGLAGGRSLIDRHSVDLLYCDLSTVTSAVLPIADEVPVPFMATVFLDDFVERSDHTIRNLPRGYDESVILIDYLKTNFPRVERILLLGSDDDFGRSSIAQFRKASENSGLVIAGEDFIPNDPSRIPAFAAALTRRDFDAIYAASLMPSLGAFFQNVRSNGLNVPLLTTNAFSLDYMQEAAGAARPGIIYGDFPQTEAYEVFRETYRSRFGEDPTPMSILLYDGLKIILTEMVRHDGDWTEILENLEGRDFDGVYGTLQFSNREIRYPLKVTVAE